MSNIPFEASQFRSFYGPIIEQMPFLLADQRLPITPKQLMYARTYGVPEHDRTLFQTCHVDTACAFLYEPSGFGEVKVVLYSHPLAQEMIHSLNPESVLHHGALVITPDQYHAFGNETLVISKDDANTFRSMTYSLQSKRQAFWDYIAEGDQSLVTDYQEVMNQHTDGDMKNQMGLWLGSTPGMRLLCLGSRNFRSVAYGTLCLDHGCLVGMSVAEPFIAPTREQALQTTHPQPLEGRVI
ncbi:hypothetical protein HZB02_05475 [Candidatus Woesearchaeota archaeon]|nr:hypothetical protein [Candidatus Woesearchaeota archaeon]